MNTERIQEIFRKANVRTKAMMLTIVSILIERDSGIICDGVDETAQHRKYLEESECAIRAVLAELSPTEVAEILEEAIGAKEEFDQAAPAMQQMLLSRVLGVAVFVPGSGVAS